MSENGEIYTAGKNFTLPPAVTAWTNLTSGEYLSFSQTKSDSSKQHVWESINVPNGTSFGRNRLETCCIFPFLDFLFGAKNKKGGSWYLWDIFLVEFLYKLHLVILIGFHLLWFSQRFVHLFFIYFNFQFSCYLLLLLIVLCFPFELFVVK